METYTRIFEDICCHRRCNPDTLEQVVVLAVEIAREGREGRRIGTIFTVSDSDEVVERSRPMILDPLLGHSEEAKRLGHPDVRETVKELAQLDGGFVVTDDGIVKSASRFFDASPEGVELPLGLGSRHLAGASISLRTQAVAVVVSESSIVRVFEDGELVAEIIPELWMLRRRGLFLKDHEIRRIEDDIAIFSKQPLDHFN